MDTQRQSLETLINDATTKAAYEALPADGPRASIRPTGQPCRRCAARCERWRWYGRLEAVPAGAAGIDSEAARVSTSSPCRPRRLPKRAFETPPPTSRRCRRPAPAPDPDDADAARQHRRAIDTRAQRLRSAAKSVLGTAFEIVPRFGLAADQELGDRGVPCSSSSRPICLKLRGEAAVAQRVTFIDGRPSTSPPPGARCRAVRRLRQCRCQQVPAATQLILVDRAVS